MEDCYYDDCYNCFAIFSISLQVVFIVELHVDNVPDILWSDFFIAIVSTFKLLFMAED